MKRIGQFILAITLLLFTVSALDAKTFVKEYTYQASEIDSKVSCRTVALELVKRLLLEELGVYLESQTEVKNFQLTKERIIVLSAGITRTEIIDERFDGRTYWLKARIEADPDETVRAIDNLRKDRGRVKEIEEIREKAESALKENEKLRKELAVVKASQSTISKYGKTIKDLTAADWFEKGLSFLSSGDNKEAIDAFTKAVELKPEDASAMNNIGLSYGSLGNLEKSIEYYNRAIVINPGLAGAYNGRGAAYATKGLYRQAESDFQKSIKLDPKNDIGFRNLGILYKRTRQYDLAMANFNKAVQVSPEYYQNYSERGSLFDTLNKYSSALDDYNKALELNQNHIITYNNRGVTYANMGKYDMAFKDFDKAIELGTKDATHYYNRGMAYLNLKNFDAGMKDCLRAIEMKPDYADAYNTVGKIYYRVLNNHESAIKYFSKAIELNATKAEFYADRARAYMDSGNRQRAIDDVKVAARLGDREMQKWLKNQGIDW